MHASNCALQKAAILIRTQRSKVWSRPDNGQRGPIRLPLNRRARRVSLLNRAASAMGVGGS
jgi:hypothetical protein